MRFLQVEEILLIHEYMLEKQGGAPGLQNLALLESAFFRPKTSYGGKELYKTIFEKAACLIHALILNHPFVDGNKRTAMVAGILFLNLNGYLVKLTNEKLNDIALNTANKKLNVNQLAKILEKHSRI